LMVRMVTPTPMVESLVQTPEERSWLEAWRSEENVGVFDTSSLDGVVSNPRGKLKAISRMSIKLFNCSLDNILD